jgi:hypothetical protein
LRWFSTGSQFQTGVDFFWFYESRHSLAHYPLQTRVYARPRWNFEHMHPSKYPQLINVTLLRNPGNADVIRL